MDTSEAPTYSVQETRTSTAVSRPGRYAATAGLVLLVASVSLNVILAAKVRSFRHFQSTKASERLLKVGTIVLPIVARRLDGQQEVITYQGGNQPTVLYVFTPPCSWCARNIDNFKALMEKQRGQYRFIGLSLSEQGLPEYIVKNDLRLPVYSWLSLETLKAYKLGSTPQTIVISPEGKVLQDWLGAYEGGQKSDVESFFHVSLPGLRELPKAQAAKN